VFKHGRNLLRHHICFIYWDCHLVRAGLLPKNFMVAGGGVSPLRNGYGDLQAIGCPAASFISMQELFAFSGLWRFCIFMDWTGGYVLFGITISPIFTEIWEKVYGPDVYWGIAIIQNGKIVCGYLCLDCFFHPMWLVRCVGCGVVFS